MTGMSALPSKILISKCNGYYNKITLPFSLLPVLILWLTVVDCANSGIDCCGEMQPMLNTGVSKVIEIRGRTVSDLIKCIEEHGFME